MKKILVVEDSALCREAIHAVLSLSGYQVEAVADAAAAITALSTHSFELVVLDLGLPDQRGENVLASMRSTPNLAEVPVIVLTVTALPERVVQVAKLGISGYLSKNDFSMNHMLEIVRAALEDPKKSWHGPPAVHAPATTESAPRAAPSCRTIDESTPLQHDESSLASLGPALTRHQVQKRLNAADNELRGLSLAVTRVLQLTSSPDCSVDALSLAVEQDPGLALRILKLANSAAYSRGTAVDSVRRAVVHMGIARIREAALALGVVDRFSAPVFSTHLDTSQFWEHSISCGLIAAALAKATDPDEADAAFICGLLHDIGRVILAERLGSVYTNVLQAAQDSRLPLEVVELQALSLTHADIMDDILRSWQLPKELVSPIAAHHLSIPNVKVVAPQYSKQAIRLITADRIAHALLLGSSGNDTIYPTVDLCRGLGIDASVLARIESEIALQTDDLKFLMLSRSSDSAWPSRVEEYRKQLNAPFRPLFVGVEESLNAFRMFCTALSGKAPGRPNVAVVDMSGIESERRGAELLDGAEREAGVSELPVIVLLPKPMGQKESVSLGRRGSLTLTMPVAVPSFIMALNRFLPHSGRKTSGVSAAA